MGMRKIIRIFFATAFLLLILPFIGQDIHADSSVNCNAQFFADSGLSTPLSSITTVSQDAFNINDIYVAYEIGDTTANPSIHYCYEAPGQAWSNAQPSWCPGDIVPYGINIANAGTFTTQTINGRIYAVGRIPAAQLSPWARFNLSSIKFLLRANGTSCSSRSSLTVNSPTESCNLNASAYEAGDNWQVNYTIDNNLLIGKPYRVYITGNNTPEPYDEFIPSATGDVLQRGQYISKDDFAVGEFLICLTDTNVRLPVCSGSLCQSTFTVGAETGEPGEDPWPGIEEPEVEPFDLCTQIPDTVQKGNCQTCLDSQGIWTAIGCINFENNGANIVRTLITLGLSLGGGFTLLIILFAGFTLSTSQGDPKRVSEAKELITSAVIGLLFIIFSVTILQFIGVSLFRIPGFGG